MLDYSRLAQGSKNISGNTVVETGISGTSDPPKIREQLTGVFIGMTTYEAVLLFLHPYGLLALQEKTDLKTLVS